MGQQGYIFAAKSIKYDERTRNTNRLNDSIPQDTIIKVLLKKIKLQEEEIANLRATIREYERTMESQQGRIDKLSNEVGMMRCIVTNLSPEERKEMKENPLYQMSLIEKHNLSRKNRALQIQVENLSSQLYAKKEQH